MLPVSSEVANLCTR